MGQDDNNKAVLDTVAGGSFGECLYAEIAEKLEKISRNNKAWSTRMSDTGRKKLGFVQKDVTGCIKDK